MNLAFLKIKVFKKNFAIYISVLAFICTILLSLIILGVITRTISSYRMESESAFIRVEKSIETYNMAIDNYMQSIYANKEILNDFLFFFGNNAEQYFTKHLLFEGNTYNNISFIDDCKKFVAQSNGMIKQINFISNLSTNTIKFDSFGNAEFDFNMDDRDVALKTHFPQYNYIYEKELPNPVNLKRKMGTIQFVLDISPQFSSLEKYNFKYAFVMNEKNISPLISETNTDLSNKFHQLFSNEMFQGKIDLNFLNNIHYTIHSSDQYSFSIATATDDVEIIKINFVTLLLLLAGFILFFTIMSIIIALRMNYDAKYLLSILDSINSFKEGHFTKHNIQRRNDEYYMIADSLNDMSDKINQYISQEYILKIKQQKAEMKALEHQINPHFLYNTLEIIRSKAYINGDEVVANAVYNLGSMYRNIVKSDQIITYRDEIKMLTQYLELMEFKYEDNFYYQIDVPDSILERNTVKFWMQPLVENFFAHGFNKDNPYNLILILGEESDTCYTIEIVDNGKNINTDTLAELNCCLNVDTDDSTTDHIGIKNVYLRLCYYYENLIKMSIENNEQAGITVRIIINKGDIE